MPGLNNNIDPFEAAWTATGDDSKSRGLLINDLCFHLITVLNYVTPNIETDGDWKIPTRISFHISCPLSSIYSLSIREIY